MNPSDDLIFEMGLYKATFPRRLKYSPMHFWFRTENNLTRIGLSSYANRLLSDLFRVDWKVKPAEHIDAEQPIGEVESTKATSELYAPMSGRLSNVNVQVVQEPSVVSVDPYSAWLLEFEGSPQSAMTAEEYVAYLGEGWEETVKLLKGQM
ncbi:MAG TPA: biotin/lipoyl-containing protein [Planctomycetota bacterium]|nr:biotin/lipoyl-containing protein [Planctomycetota bacterium]